jgi:sulfide:quinone oxidoreductase
MNYARLSDNYSVAPQIQAADVEFFAGEGFTTLICNRPDGEDTGQPPSAAIRDACEQHGIEFHMIPMQGRMLSPETVSQFLDVMSNASGPVARARQYSGKSRHRPRRRPDSTSKSSGARPQ